MATIVDSVLNKLRGLGSDKEADMEPVSEHGYIMALDAGTTSVRAILFDEFGGKVAQA